MKGMFEGCTGITETPNLPATTLVEGCYKNMFKGCSSLNYVDVEFTNWNGDATENWVDGVKQTGTFVSPFALDKTTFSSSRVPLNSDHKWSVLTAATAKETISYNGTQSILDTLPIEGHGHFEYALDTTNNVYKVATTWPKALGNNEAADDLWLMDPNNNGTNYGKPYAGMFDVVPTSTADSDFVRMYQMKERDVKRNMIVIWSNINIIFKLQNFSRTTIFSTHNQNSRIHTSYSIN